MRKWISSHLQYYSLRQKISLIFGLTMMIVCMVNIITYVNLNRIEKTVNSVYDSNRNLQQITTTMDEIQTNVYAYLNTRGTDELEGYYRASAEFREYMEGFNDRPTNDSLKLKEKNIRSLGETWIGFTEQAILAKRGRDIAGYGQAYQQAEEVYQYLQIQLKSLSTELFARSTEQYHALALVRQRILVLCICEILLVLVFNLMVLLYFLEHFTQPLALLAGYAEQVGKGDLALEPLEVQSHDEVGIVSDAFNSMVQSLQEYIELLRQQMEAESRLKEEKLLMEVHLKDAQMGALQARINPHFLYNTMNAGAQLAMMEDADRTYAFLENVTDFFRYNTRNNGKETWLEEEITQVESYIYIMNTRYADEIDYQACYPERLPRVHIPGMVLQPLVENAIEHGIRGLEGYKRLCLSVREEEDLILVEIEDNGVGISAQKIKSLMQAAKQFQPAGERGIGLPNVINRLRLYYGTEDAVRIYSEGEYMGTRIQIRIPREVQDVSDHAGG